ncbi:hypothetical protein D9619_009290 [Psilocybe cf. subviscida]|uniref:Uncharacterized protein n=1 Tax=Psilocybe cf. subviscida TaxID=2480587 RepID=A0A8H5BTX0_9AGAR|nr:hypothetical protein D9619_009290 [Psilocybe cf. subviscida]
MALALAVISFLFAVLISALAPVERVRSSIPHTAIIWWFVLVNLIHGVNAVLWLDNINIHIPVWCDITTKLQLGARIGLPGAFLCIAMELERISSSRRLLTNAIVVRNRLIFEVILCHIIPIIYMLSHLIVQDHRFDIVRDLGCVASSHPSTPGFVIPWVPPVFLCLLVFAYCGVSLHHANLDRIDNFTTYLKSRGSTMDSSLFIRRLVTCLIVTGAFAIINFGLLFSIPNYSSWISWALTHKDISIIQIIQPPAVIDPDVPQSKLVTAQIGWWGFFIVSLGYIILSFTIGEESRDAIKWIRKQFDEKKNRTTPRQLVLPLQDDTSSLHKTPESPVMCASHVGSVGGVEKHRLAPLNIELKSGWDDNLDDETPSKRRGLLGSLRRAPSMASCSSPTTSIRSTTPHRPSSPCKSPTQSEREDEQFMASTLSYLSSPTARTLGLSLAELTPLRIPQPVFSPHPTRTFDVPPTPVSAGISAVQPVTPTTPSASRIQMPMPTKSILKSTPPRAAVPEDITGSTTIASVFDAAWPIPPESPTPSLPPSRHGSPTRSISSSRSYSQSHTNAARSHGNSAYSHSQSPSHSPSSSVEEILQVGYALYPTTTHPRAPHPHRRSRRPFEGSSVSSLVDVTVPAPLVSVGPVPQSRSGSGLVHPIRSLRRNWSRERMRAASPVGSEVIRMTVVQEIV